MPSHTFGRAAALAALASVLPLARAAAQPAAIRSRSVHAAPAATVAHPAWSRRATIYEINVRQYTPEGTFAALLPHLARIRALGIDAIWLMPIQPIGVKNRKGVLGSYYSVRDYRAVNPEFGTTADVVRVVAEAHRLGMKVLLDWVPNHTAYDHPWITEHPDWYEHKPDGSIHNARDNEGHETDWTDVAELDYGNRDMRRAMIADMRYWLDAAKVDGFRCDVAGGVPEDFWRDARDELARGRPAFFMLAEAEGPKYYDAFDMTYGWSLWDLMVDVSKGKKPASAYAAYFARQDSVLPPDGYVMTFTTNHDKNSWDGTEFELMGANNAPSYVLAATGSRSLPMLYSGQEVTLNKRLRFFERDTIDWRGPSRAAFFRRVFELKHTQPALEAGAAGGAQRTLATSDSGRVYAFTRTRGPNTVLVAVNYGDGPARVTYAGLERPGDYADWFDGTRVTLGAGGALELPAHGYRVLVRR